MVGGNASDSKAPHLVEEPARVDRVGVVAHARESEGLPYVLVPLDGVLIEDGYAAVRGVEREPAGCKRHRGETLG